MLIILQLFKNLCDSVINSYYSIWVEADRTVYDDYDDFISSHGDLICSSQLIISLCINGPFIQFNVEVLKNAK